MKSWLATVVGYVLVSGSALADPPPDEPPKDPPTEPPVEAPVDTPPVEPPKPEPPKPEPPKPEPPKPEPPKPEPPKASEPEKSWLGLPPLGSYLYATSTAEFGVTFGSFPTAGGFGTGFHYAERGGLFAKYLLASLAGGASASAAQARANQTGQTQYYERYSPDDFGNVGLDINALSTQLGGNVSGTQAELFGIKKIRRHSQLPALIDFGPAFYYFKGPSSNGMDMMGNPLVVEHEVWGIGFVLGVLAPITRWAQLEIHARPVLPGNDGNPWLTVETTGTVNLGNRLYGRAGAIFSQTGDASLVLGAGGRL